MFNFKSEFSKSAVDRGYGIGRSDILGRNELTLSINILKANYFRRASSNIYSNNGFHGAISLPFNFFRFFLIYFIIQLKKLQDYDIILLLFFV